ncbi:MAG TPA: hypothetical protein VK939_02075 [Longimicrobiales bacterium]|nr:hypothetical protein [Longimicrobiales bacterium]
MNEFRAWWANAVKTVLETVGQLLERLMYGIMHGWQMTYILLGGVLAVILGMFYLWKRKA